MSFKSFLPMTLAITLFTPVWGNKETLDYLKKNGQLPKPVKRTCEQAREKTLRQECINKNKDAFAKAYDLSGEDLSGINLSGVDLSGADLRDAYYLKNKKAVRVTKEWLKKQGATYNDQTKTGPKAELH